MYQWILRSFGVYRSYYSAHTNGPWVQSPRVCRNERD